VNTEDASDTISLTQEDVIVYDFNIGLFREIVCDILGFRPSRAEIGQYGHAFPVGNWEPVGGQSYPVHWITARDPRVCGKQVREMLFDNPSPMIFLTPSRRKWDMDTLGIIAKHKSTIAPLDELVTVDGGGRWCATPLWNETLTHFYRVQNPLATTLELPPYSFCKRGQMWVVRFNGMETFLKDGVGPQHISALLSQPGKSVYAVDLQMLASKQDIDTAPRPTAAGEMSDTTAIREVERRAKELLSDLDTARREGNSLLESEIEDEIDQLKDYLCQVRGLGGESRKSGNPADSIRRSVQQMIKKSIDTISDELPDCAKHLSRSIRTGFVVSYTPECEIHWVL
jgi:hypothetical protein